MRPDDSPALDASVLRLQLLLARRPGRASPRCGVPTACGHGVQVGAEQRPGARGGPGNHSIQITSLPMARVGVSWPQALRRVCA
jgi:hypothetical protein